MIRITTDKICFDFRDREFKIEITAFQDESDAILGFATGLGSSLCSAFLSAIDNLPQHDLDGNHI
jgi:hypothetical protein